LLEFSLSHLHNSLGFRESLGHVLILDLVESSLIVNLCFIFFPVNLGDRSRSSCDLTVDVVNLNLEGLILVCTSLVGGGNELLPENRKDDVVGRENCVKIMRQIHE